MFQTYFTEIKNRSLLVVLTCSITSFACYIYKQQILFIFIQPTVFNLTFIVTSITEIFELHLQLVFFLTSQTLLIYTIYHCLLFFLPALYSYEMNLLKIFFQFSLSFWFIMILLLNKLIFPLSWKFFIVFYESLNIQIFKIHFESRLFEYINFYLSLYYICVLNCQILILLIIYLKIFNISPNFAQQVRKFTYFGFLLFSTIITPPDIFSQLIVSLSFILSYEFLIYFQLFKMTLKLLIREPIETNQNSN